MIPEELSDLRLAARQATRERIEMLWAEATAAERLAAALRDLEAARGETITAGRGKAHLRLVHRREDGAA